MNAETRAKEIVSDVLQSRKVGGTALNLRLRQDFVAAISAAITRAENDKLEEAARLMDRVMADSKAALLRTLKHED